MRKALFFPEKKKKKRFLTKILKLETKKKNRDIFCY